MDFFISMVVQIAFGPISVCLVSRASWIIARRVNSKMAGDDLGRAANSDA